MTLRIRKNTLHLFIVSCIERIRIDPVCDKRQPDDQNHDMQHYHCCNIIFDRAKFPLLHSLSFPAAVYRGYRKYEHIDRYYRCTHRSR